MRILVANLGSTSFKARLFEVSEGVSTVLGKVGFERVTDYRQAILDGLDQLVESGAMASIDEISAVGFKTVLGHNLTGCVAADQRCVKSLRDAAGLAPAHNPPYAAGIELFSEILPQATLVALFETAFYQWVSEAASHYAIPASWREIGVRRYGFHGASHKFIAERSAELLERPDVAQRTRALYHQPLSDLEDSKPLRVISCHLGGSSSVTGILNGVAIGTSMGLSPQSGLPQNNRVGDLDSMAVPYVMRQLGLSLDDVEKQMTKESGLLGLSGVSNDIRDVKKAAAEGNADARLALDHLVHSIRHWIGAFWLQLGGCDALVFTAGIGENGPDIREAVCRGLEGMGITLDPEANQNTFAVEACISSDDSPTSVWVVPANEESVLAAETFRYVQAHALV